MSHFIHFDRHLLYKQKLFLSLNQGDEKKDLVIKSENKIIYLDKL